MDQNRGSSVETSLRVLNSGQSGTFLESSITIMKACNLRTVLEKAAKVLLLGHKDEYGIAHSKSEVCITTLTLPNFKSIIVSFP